MNFSKTLITIFAALVIIVTCLIVGTTYGTRLAVNNRKEETTTERTCRTTSIKPYEPPSNNFPKEDTYLEVNIEETAIQEERTAALTSRYIKTEKEKTTSQTNPSKRNDKDSINEFTTLPVSATSTTTTTEPTTIEEQDESSVLLFYGLRHFKVGTLF